MYDCIIIGCGFAGACAARALADAGRRVLIIDRRPHVGGNMYDAPDENGVLVHRYGPHIFHTGNKEVFDFLSRFSDFFPYEHRVLGKISGALVPIPFNFDSLEALWPRRDAERTEALLLRAFPGKSAVSVLELRQSGDPDIRRAGQYVYDNVFKNYTAKQWGVRPETVDSAVIARVPVRLGRDARYFADPIQYMPSAGFTELFKKMLAHPLITVELRCDAGERLGLDETDFSLSWDNERITAPVIYTGPADELFSRRFGALPYRSLELAFERLPQTFYQPAAVVNYPNEERFTRITEFKYLTGQQIEGATTILREYPMPYDPEAKKGNVPYYPISSPESRVLYEKYALLASRFHGLHLCGRLAQFRYYNMDAAAAASLELARTIICDK